MASERVASIQERSSNESACSIPVRRERSLSDKMAAAP